MADKCLKIYFSVTMACSLICSKVLESILHLLQIQSNRFLDVFFTLAQIDNDHNLSVRLETYQPCYMKNIDSRKKQP